LTDWVEAAGALLGGGDRNLSPAYGGFARDCGCDVVGPVARVADGVKLASSERLDGAILDINIAGTEVFPVASELARGGVPFIFVSGYDSQNLPEAWRGRPILKKPFRSRDLARNMVKAFANRHLRRDQTAGWVESTGHGATGRH